jgi:hypothetical protein
MAEYVYSGQNIFHVPPRIDPQGNPEKTTPGAVFAPGIPTELDDRDAQNPLVQQLMKAGSLRPAQDEDKARAAEIEDERKRELAEQEQKAKQQAGGSAGKR